jgi:DNA-binding NtrC family response regulator
MIEAIALAHVFAPAARPVIPYGETGTGKTFFAEYIHQLSGRPDGFHTFSVGTMAPQLVFDELFGHVEGAYTDARRVRAGRIVTAGRGTLLLDDFQNLDLAGQKPLVQVLDRGTYSPVGSDRVAVATCRFILAMSDAPDVLMRQGVLLKDLRYRFGGCAIWMPPLRERRLEIPIHAQRALERCPEETKLEGPTRFTDAALAVLCESEFPGNVRELRGVVEYGFLMARAAGADRIGREHLPRDLTAALRYERRGNREVNRRVVEQTLRITGGNVSEAARLLGTSRQTVAALRSMPM